jgi:hypothetical protein
MATYLSLIATPYPKLAQLGLPLYCLITSTDDAPDFDIIGPSSRNTRQYIICSKHSFC